MCAPDPPDTRAAAIEQGQSGKENLAQQTYANRPTQNTPWGSTSFTTGRMDDPGTGVPVTTWTQNQTLTPQLQSALNDQINIQAGRSGAANTLLGQATSAFQSPLNFGALPPAGSFGGVGYRPDFSAPGYQPGMVGNRGYQPDRLTEGGDALRNRAEQALFQRQKNLIEPGLTESEAARRTRLANMGISPEGGSEAWNRAQTSMGQTRNQAYENAALNAIAGGGAEAQRELGMDISRGGYNLAQVQGAQGLDTAREQANLGLASGAQGIEAQRLNMATSATDTMTRQRQQALAEEQLRRNLTLNELNALLTGQQVQNPQMPSFVPAGVAPATPFLSAAQTEAGGGGGGSGVGTLIGGVAGSFFGPMGTAIGSQLGGAIGGAATR